MKEILRQAVSFTRSVLFTFIVHSVLIVLLLSGLWWPDFDVTVNRGKVKPMQAVVLNTQVVEAERQRKEEEAERQRKEEEAERQRKEEEAERQRKEEEAERQRKEEEAERQRKEEEAERQRKEEEAERQRKEEELRKQLEADQLQKQIENEAIDALTAFHDRIAAAVEQNWRRPPGISHGLSVIIRVSVARNGDVLSANVIKSSGDPLFDSSAELAAKKASPLPFPSDPKYYEYIHEFHLSFNPDDL